MQLLFSSYHGIKLAKGYELLEKFNKPFSLKYNCVAMFDNHAEVMIEIQHSGNFIRVFNEAMFLDNGLKLFHV